MEKGKLRSYPCHLISWVQSSTAVLLNLSLGIWRWNPSTVAEIHHLRNTAAVSTKDRVKSRFGTIPAQWFFAVNRFVYLLRQQTAGGDDISVASLNNNIISSVRVSIPLEILLRVAPGRNWLCKTRCRSAIVHLNQPQLSAELGILAAITRKSLS